jgi:hypothetical protein
MDGMYAKKAGAFLVAMTVRNKLIRGSLGFMTISI